MRHVARTGASSGLLALLGIIVLLSAVALVGAYFAGAAEPQAAPQDLGTAATQPIGAATPSLPEAVPGERAPVAAPVAESTATTGAESLRGLVVDSTGRPLADLKLELLKLGKGGDMAQFVAISGPDGAIAWRGMPSGRYLPRGVGFEVVEPGTFDFVATDSPPVLRFVCLLDLALAGRVLEADDRGVPGVWVIVEDRSGAEVAKITTAADGGFRVKLKAKTVVNPDVRLWVFSYGRLAMTRKLEATWGQTELVLRVAPAPTGTLLVVDTEGAPVRNYRLWVDLAPGARAASPWVAEGWIGFAPGIDPRLPGLGLVPQRLSIFPAEHRFACTVVDVPGGDACRDQRVPLTASAELLVRTVPPVAGVRVHVVRLPPTGGRPRPMQSQRLRLNPLRQDEVISLGDQATDASGSARIRGGSPGEAVTVTVFGAGAAGECDTVLAAYSELLVPIEMPAVLDVVLTSDAKGSEARTLSLQRLAPDGGPDRLARAYPLAFGAATYAADISTVFRGPPLERQLHQRVLQPLLRGDVEAIAKLSVDPALPAELRGRLEVVSRRDRSRCHFDFLPPGRYRIVSASHGEPSTRPLAEFSLAPGERAEQRLELPAQGAIDLRLQLPAGLAARALVDEATGSSYPLFAPRAGPTRLLAAGADRELWLSRDVADLPAQGLFPWAPDLAPMRITLRMRTARGAPVAGRAVSRLAASEVTAGWHGAPLGQTDDRGEVALRRDAMPFKLRVDGVATLLGPYEPDLRRHEQVIEIEVPER